MKGNIFEINNNWMNLYKIKEDFFDPMIGLAFDWVKEEKGMKNTESINELIAMMYSYGAKTGIEFEYQYFELTDEVKQNYFRERFREVKLMIRDMTLEEFSSNVSLLIEKIENPDDVFVCDNSSIPWSMDYWIRDAEPGRYYVGASFITH